MPDPLLPGTTHPLGATVRGDGVNFCVYAPDATSVELMLFDDAEASAPSRTVTLDVRGHRTNGYWHVYLPGLKAGQLYGYCVDGPFDPSRGLRFDREKLLIDPYAKSIVTPTTYDRQAARQPGTTVPTAMRSVVVDPDAYDWEGDLPLRRPWAQTVIYEMHARGFTAHPNSGVSDEKRGTYAGLIEKLPYLVDLGVTAIELLPVFQYDPQDAPPGRLNYWGYSPVNWFSPHLPYASTPDPVAAVNEFRDMVKACHRAGLEVILDVVYNHTAELDVAGPTLSFRGLHDAGYYQHAANDPSKYLDFTGCGNSVNANDAVTQRLILDSLRYWVRHMHIDGFRFDLCSTLTRGPSGKPMAKPPVIMAIDSDPVLAGIKRIAEAWDPGGLYQVGTFPGQHWSEWNGKFRDEVRAFVRGDHDKVGRLSSRLLASPDLYERDHLRPEQSVNFITCHDGFTLNDLVSYNEKHNLDNGENNRDGDSHNTSYNHGTEGPTDDPAVEAVRVRQIKNLLTLNLLALGAPMLSMGDEVRRTQHGNNNAYCQDNEISWFDWGDVKKHADVLAFTKGLLRLRQSFGFVAADPRLTLDTLLRKYHIRWSGIQLDQPDWTEHSHSLAVTVTSLDGQRRFHAMFNAYREALTFELPAPEAKPWQRVIDTALGTGEDIATPETLKAVKAVKAKTYEVTERSIVILSS